MNCQETLFIRHLSVFIFAVLLSVHTLPGLAQGQTGSIAGSVTDPSGAYLRGAQVSLESKTVSAVSDEQGRFAITGLAPGNYTIAITYVGFKVFTQSVNVTAGQTANVNAKLQLQSQNQEVLVTAPRAGGEVEAVNVERTADNIVQVLPAEVIRSLPNANMADALGRLPSVTLERDEGEGKYVQVRGTEPRLTNTTIDGVNIPSPESDVRQIKFDAIPADSVESVQVNKTLEANMDGDGIGGSVNLVTKTATDVPIISLGVMGGYTPIINGRGLTEETGTIGKRFGADKKVGFLIGGSYDWNGRGIDDMEPAPDLATLSDGTTSPWFDAVDYREYQYFRSRWGVNGSSDYRMGTGSDVYLRWFYSDFKNYGDRWAYSLNDNTPGVTLLNGNGGDPSFNVQRRAPDIGVGSLILGGTHVFSNTWYSWDVSAARSFDRNDTPASSKFKYLGPDSTCQFDPSSTTNQYLPQWTSNCFTEAYGDPSLFQMKSISLDKGLTAQMNLQVAGAMGKRYHIGSRSAIIEFGGKFRNVHKYADTYNIELDPNDPTLLSSFPNSLTTNNYYLGGDYKLGYMPNVESMVSYANAHTDAFSSISTQGLDTSFFDMIEKVGAGYVMNTIDFTGHVRLVAGLRVERTSDSVGNFSINSDTGALSPNSFKGSYTTVLPSASLKIGVGSNNYLRLVYARGLSRPDPADIAQPLSWSTSGNGANKYSVSFGNANLKAEIGDDIDVLFEHYIQQFGVVSVGYFYKHLSNPIVTKDFQLVNYLPPGAPPDAQGNYLATQPVNAGSAWVTGFEASYIQHFTSLPGAWGGLGLSANYGYTDSRTSNIPGRSDHPRLLRTSPNAFNISPTFDRGRFSLRVGLSYNEASIYGYQYSDGTPGGVNGPLSDIYFYSHLQVDAQGSVRLAHGFSLVAYGLNLNNEVFGFYQGGPQFMIQREYYQPSYAIGVRWNSRGEK